MLGSLFCGLGKAFGGCSLEIPTLKYAGMMTYQELESILVYKFPGVPFYLPDSTYATCTKEDIARFLAWDSTNDKKYEAESYDCDDFTWRLKGNITVPPWSWLPFGIVWTNLHALCCFVDNERKFWFVEPQLDKIQEQLETWQGKELRFIAL